MSDGEEQLAWEGEVESSGGDPDEGTAYVIVKINAGSQIQALSRAMVWLQRNFEDDFRGASASIMGRVLVDKEGERPPGRYVVKVNLGIPWR